ncbi:MAG: site-2 protease family protein, partial [Limisphaerales bacterium]
TLGELRVSEEEFSPRAMEMLRPRADSCHRLGFHSPFYIAFETVHRETSTSAITLTHPSGAAARLTYTVSHKAQPPKETVKCFILSQFRDGTFLVTANQRQHFSLPPGVVANRLIGAGADTLIQAHLQKLSQSPINNPVEKMASSDDAIRIWDRYEKHGNDFAFQRGRYVWMTPEETSGEQQRLSDAKTMAAGNEQDVAVLIELNKLQNGKASWTGMAMLFVVSLVLFIGAGMRRWSMSYLAILVGVVFVHELGHYLAMRRFNYRNVRMFFIPFFGAAVSGRHYNVPGWKKAIVSLMGPAPGIYLALLVGGLGWYLHKPILFKIALVSVLLNGINLIPVLPLDGGWIFHSLLFSRHYMLDVVFRTLAAVVLMVGAAMLKLKSLLYVGILMLIALPATYRMVRIAASMKKQGFVPVSEDDQTIPAATAQAIIAEVRRSNTRPQSNKSIAQQTLRIFEMLNARPPGWSATVGLLFVQCVSIVIAAVFAVAFMLGQNWQFIRFARNFGKPPGHRLAIGQIQTWNGDSTDGSSAVARDTVVATFRDPTRARAAFQDMTNRLPAGTELKLFGESLLLSLPAANGDTSKQWLRELSRRSSDAFLDTTN